MKASIFRQCLALGLLGLLSPACHEQGPSDACTTDEACGCATDDCADPDPDDDDTKVDTMPVGQGDPDEGGGESSGGRVPLGDQPCPGCAGDPCEVHDDCLEGFICARVDDDTALCTNCPLAELNPLLPSECSQPCTADVHCGDGGTCQGGVCFHECSGDDDCPDGYLCQEGAACVPADLPQLAEECAETGGYLCAPDAEEERLCLSVSDDTGVLDSWCSKPCTSDLDCIDTWANGCCSEVPNANDSVSYWCAPQEWGQFCGS